MQLLVLLTVAVIVSAIHNNGKESHRYTNATSYDGWALLGKYCMGYSSPQTGEGSTGGMNEIGNIDLKIQSYQNYENLTVLIYDDEPTSWGALKEDMTCVEKYKYAKDFSQQDYFKVVINPVTQRWSMQRTPLFGHVQPRTWYVVLARCANVNTDDHKFDVMYDLHWSDNGVYNNGMGPDQCVDNGVVVDGTRVVLGVFIGIFAVITFLLAFYVKGQRVQLKRGIGVRLSEETADDE